MHEMFLKYIEPDLDSKLLPHVFEIIHWCQDNELSFKLSDRGCVFIQKTPQPIELFKLKPKDGIIEILLYSSLSSIYPFQEERARLHVINRLNNFIIPQIPYRKVSEDIFIDIEALSGKINKLLFVFTEILQVIDSRSSEAGECSQSACCKHV